MYWAYDDSITEETDPNCAKWFSINGARHPVVARKVPGEEVDGLSVFHFDTNYGSTSVAAVDSEGVSSPAVTSGQAVPPATYVIKYDANGATGGTAPASQNKTQYTDITLATNSGGLTRIGYRFSGWNTAPDGNGTPYPAGATYSADESVTLYAKWEAVNAVVLTPESSAVNHGATVTLTPPTMDATIYYQIGGASETKANPGQSVTVTLHNASNPPQNQNTTGAYAGIPEGGKVTITAYAKYADGTQSEVTTGDYSLNQYTVSYNGNKHTGGKEPSQQIFYSGGSVTVQGKDNLTKIGYTFTGWQGDDGQPYSQGNVYGGNENLTLTAQWDPNTYYVSFDSNGGSGSMDDQPFTYDGKQALSPNDFTPPTGYEFVGWKDDDSNVYTDNQSVSNLTDIDGKTVTLTAQWGCQLQDSAQQPSGYTSPHAPSNDSWKYVEFGYWPQTVKEDNVTVYTKLSKEVGMFTYYLGSDGNWYVEVTAKPYEDTYTYTYTDGKSVEKDKEVYFKVEPIVWRVLTENYNSTGNALLLAESILTGGILYYVDRNTRTITGAGTKQGEPNTVYPNNWQYSTIRAWLNGSYEEKDTQPKTYTNKGFLQTAFTADAQSLIAETVVDNSAASTNPASDPNLWNNGENPYASKTPTTDKIFLLSMQEASDSEYGFAAYDAFGEGNTRIRVTTDYAKATGAGQDSKPGYGGSWWLRSPYHVKSNVRLSNETGYTPNYVFVNGTGWGVVPALCIPVSELP